MEDGQAYGSYRNHATLEDHESGLIIRQWPMEAARKFRHAKAGSDQYRKSGGSKTPEKALENHASKKPFVGHIPALRVAPQAKGKLTAEDCEQDKRKDLERETTNHDVNTHLSLARDALLVYWFFDSTEITHSVIISGGRCNGTTNSLQ